MTLELLIQISLHLALIGIELFFAGYIYESRKQFKEEKEKFLELKMKYSSENYFFYKNLMEEYDIRKKNLIMRIKEFLAKGKDVSEV